MTVMYPVKRQRMRGAIHQFDTLADFQTRLFLLFL